MDGEDSEITEADLDSHLAVCPACTRFAARSTSLHRRVRVRAAEPVPDRTAAIVAAVRSELPARTSTASQGPEMQAWRARASWARPALAMTALTQLALALPALLLGDDHGAGIHIAHEQGSWEAALAVALLFVVSRPSRATGLLPFVGALAVVLMATAGIDISQGRAPALGEMHHLLDVAGIVFLWFLTPPNPNAPTHRWHLPFTHAAPTAS